MPKKYICVECSHTTNNKYNYSCHLKTNKHLNRVNNPNILKLQSGVFRVFDGCQNQEKTTDHVLETQERHDSSRKSLYKNQTKILFDIIINY